MQIINLVTAITLTLLHSSGSVHSWFPCSVVAVYARDDMTAPCSIYRKLWAHLYLLALIVYLSEPAGSDLYTCSEQTASSELKRAWEDWQWQIVEQWRPSRQSSADWKHSTSPSSSSTSSLLSASLSGSVHIIIDLCDLSLVSKSQCTALHFDVWLYCETYVPRRHICQTTTTIIIWHFDQTRESCFIQHFRYSATSYLSATHCGNLAKCFRFATRYCHWKEY